MHLHRCVLIVGFLSIIAFWAQAQSGNIQDCLGAIPVCDEMYVESESPSGTGNINEIQAGETCTDGELNSIWYLFTTNQNGLLGFEITPNDLNDDYDWALFDITDASCQQLANNPNAFIVSCNAAGGNGCHGVTGANGQSNDDNQGAGCSFGNSPFNAMIPMQAGQTYALMVSNWTGSTNGYTIDFGPSTGVDFVDNVSPEVEEAVFPESCLEDEIQITFNEYMDCGSLQAANFTLNGPGGPYSLTLSDAGSCGQNSEYTTEITLGITPAIASRGEFTLVIDPTNNSQLLDLCGNQLPVYNLDFTVSIPIDIFPELGADTSLVCAGDVLTLDATALGDIYLWSDGSITPTLDVTDAGVYAVTVEDACGVGSDSLEVIVQQFPPVLDLGMDQIACAGESVLLDVTNELSTYLWQDGSTAAVRQITTEGDYSVSVTNACGTTVDAVRLDFVPALTPDFSDRVLCLGETATLDFSHPFATYSWQDGSTDARREFTDDIALSLTITTPCETVSADFAVIFLRDPSLELGADTLLCPGDTLQLDPGIPGGIYRWQDGSTSPTLTITEAGTYSLSLTTACNELVDTRRIDYAPVIQTDLGRDTFLCEGAALRLDATADGPVTYVWEDGSQDALRRIDQPGTYIVRVLSQCETVVDTLSVTLCEMCEVYVPNIFSPNGDGTNDRFQFFSDCELTDITFRVFDRWGALLHESANLEGWKGEYNGQEAATGIYVWSLEYMVVEDGISKRRQQKGSVMLVR